MLKYMADVDAVIANGDHPLEKGVLREGCGLGCVPFMEGRNAITHDPCMLAVLESERLYALFHLLFGEPVGTFDFKWLRGVHRQAFTGAHMDSVYMSRGSQRLLTCWIPLMDIPVEMGTLAILEGSNSLPSFQQLRDTYGALDAEAEQLQGTG